MNQNTRTERRDRLRVVEHPRCEADRTLLGSECRQAGRIEFMGVLLCEGHATDLNAERCENLWLSILYQLDTWLRNCEEHMSGELKNRILDQRSHALEGLELTRSSSSVDAVSGGSESGRRT